VVDGAVRTLDADMESPMLLGADGEQLWHSEGDHVIDCYFWYPYGPRKHRRFYLGEEIIPIPTHMFLSMEGFVMPLAPKPKKGAHHDWLMELPDDEYEAIQGLLPEPLAEEYM
jgi:hypothetical protein